MAIPKPSEQDILNRIYQKILNETSITAKLNSSAIGVLLKVIAAELGLVWNYVDNLEKDSNLATATGFALDNFGLLFGVLRKQASSSSTIGYAPSVKFTNLGSSPISVSQGTRVWKSSDPSIAYFTTQGSTIAGGSYSLLHVTAVSDGTSYNVGIGELDTSNVPNASILVTNILPIQNGSFEESDASYRQRILQDLTRRDVVNIYNIDALIRSVPGVRDVFLLNLYRGTGTFDVIVIPYNTSATSQVVAEAQRLLNESIPIGISAVARQPSYRQLDVKVSLIFSQSSTSNKEGIREAIRGQIISRIDNLPVEDGSGIGKFYLSQVKALAISTDVSVLDAVVSIGLDGSPYSSDGSITLAIGERLVLRSLSVL
jgi:uncharacterized phage protein gp47/JayE